MAKNDKHQETVDLRINTNGRRRQLSVGKILPEDYDWVRVTRTRSTEDTVWLKIRRLKLIEVE